MRYIHWLISCILLLTFIGCNTDQRKNPFKGFESVIDINKVKSVGTKNNIPIVEINVPQERAINFDYYKKLKDIYFVKLETTKRSKILKISKIFITDQRIIIVDLGMVKSVFIFDITGRFISKIVASKTEKNVESDIYDFVDVAYDYGAKEIILHDDKHHKSYFFDVDGKFKIASKEYISFYRFANIKNTKYFVFLNLLHDNAHIPFNLITDIFLGEKNTNIEFIAPNAIQRFKLINHLADDNVFSSSNSNEKLFFTPALSDTIYQVDGNPVNVYPKLVIKYPGENVVSQIRGSSIVSVSRITDLYNTHLYYYFKGEILCNADSVYYIMSYKTEAMGYFFSEKTNKILGGSISTTLSFKDSAMLPVYRYPITTFNDYFVSILSASEFVNFNYLSSSKISYLKRTTLLNDNPILAFYKLIKF